MGLARILTLIPLQVQYCKKKHTYTWWFQPLKNSSQNGEPSQCRENKEFQNHHLDTWASSWNICCIQVLYIFSPVFCFPLYTVKEVRIWNYIRATPFPVAGESAGQWRSPLQTWTILVFTVNVKEVTQDQDIFWNIQSWGGTPSQSNKQTMSQHKHLYCTRDHPPKVVWYIKISKKQIKLVFNQCWKSLLLGENTQPPTTWIPAPWLGSQTPKGLRPIQWIGSMRGIF